MYKGAFTDWQICLGEKFYHCFELLQNNCNNAKNFADW